MTKQLQASHPLGGAPYGFAAASAAEVAAAAAGLAAGLPAWGAAGLQGRIASLGQWRDALIAHRDAIVHALAEDTGRLLLSQAEFAGVLGRIDYWSRNAPALLQVETAGVSEAVPSVRYAHQLAPLGVVGVISPWNFPLLLSLTDALPALLAGCGVLAKPSEITPRFIAPLMRSLRAAPEMAAMLRFLPGGPETGAALVKHVDALCFTGSVATGRSVGAAAAARLIPVFLELGGKDALLVLADADLDEAVNITLRASVIATGQACQSIERVYVHESLYAPFVSALVNAAAGVRLSGKDGDGGHLGPFIDPRQADVVAAHLADALAKGARQHCGGIERRAGGVWCRPVVLTDVHHGMLLYQQETFGPIAPVMPFADDAQAVRLANDSAFGLSAAVLGDEAHALQVAKQLRAGAVSINDAGLTAQVFDVEKDSFGVSGLGRSRAGGPGLLRFVRRQALLIQTAPPASLDAFREDG